MTTAELRRDDGDHREAVGLRHRVEVVVPVYNEEAQLAASVTRLHDYLEQTFPFGWTITIADNASGDRTWEIACELAATMTNVRAVCISQKGRGRALRAVWSGSDADVVAYMDVDLATGLDALLPLVAPLLSGHSDVAIGTRLASGARVVRGPKRELISRAYNLIVRTTTGNRFSDAQCGFKALRADVARRLLPLVEDDAWFFDTELLVLAERNGLRIHEVPVDWVDDPDSRVDITRTALDDLRGIVRMLRRFAAGEGRMAPAAGTPADVPSDQELSAQLASFARIGVVSTIAYLALFLALRPVLGAFGANAVSLALCTVANTLANRVLTFGSRGRAARRRELAGGVIAFATSLVATSALLGLLLLVAPGAPVLAELAVLVVANAAAAVARFLVLRAWVYRRHLRPA
ncbi:MAG TPA: glycosyltransferase [Acidimicrobiia bacterium]|jgi:putative flippase GtrA